MSKFKLGFAVILSFSTALVIIAALADRFSAIGGKLGAVTELSVGATLIATALPIWLMAITYWHKLHNKSYVQFKKWCIYQYNDILRAE